MFERTPSQRSARRRLPHQDAYYPPYPGYPPGPRAGYGYMPRMARRPRRNGWLLLITLLLAIPGGIWMFTIAQPLLTAREALFTVVLALLLVFALMGLALWQKRAEYYALFIFVLVCLLGGMFLH